MTSAVATTPSPGPFPSYMCLTLLWSGLAVSAVALAFASDLPRGQVLSFFLVIVVCTTALAFCFTGRAYSFSTDVTSSDYQYRGRPLGQENDELDECARDLYKYASYGSARTYWPITSVFTLMGAIVIGSLIGSPEEWLRNVLVLFLGMLLVEAYVSGFKRHHGQARLQLHLDSLYCRYRELRASTRHRA